MDAIDGLKALEQVVETIGEQLDDLYQRRDIPQIERVTLHSLEWTLAKLNYDMHTMDTEVRDLRLAEARALDDLDRANAERHAARKQIDELRAQLSEVLAPEAELSGNPGQLPAEPARQPYQWQVGDMIVRSGSLRSVLETRERSVRPEGWEEHEFVGQEFLEGYGWKLYRKASNTGTDVEGKS
jgi:hypothetical protein